VPHAILVKALGGPEVLEYTEVEPPSPGPGELLVEVATAGVNYIDTYQRRGIYPREVPFVLGQEGAGTVLEVGPGVSDFAAGDRVAWMDGQASYAEQTVIKADIAVRVPDGLSDEQAAASMVQGVTAHYLVNSTYQVKPGDTVLIHAAAGGTGLMLVQYAKSKGARVIGTVSTEEKEKLAREAGADEVIRYSEVDFVAETRRLTDGAGVPVVYDGVGKDTFDGSLACVARRGLLVLFGASSGPVPPFDPQRLNQAGSVFLTRPKAGDYAVTPQELRWRTTEVFEAVHSGAVAVRIGARYPLAEARKAHEDLQGRRTTGKLLLLPR
jgi:NADPH2:quinone reductase